MNKEYSLKIGKIGNAIIKYYKCIERRFIAMFLEKNIDEYTLKVGKMGQKLIGIYKQIEKVFINRFLEEKKHEEE